MANQAVQALPESQERMVNWEILVPLVPLVRTVLPDLEASLEEG